MKQHFASIFYGVLIFTGFQFLSCDEKNHGEFLTEGEIEYQIDYIDTAQDNPMIAFLPRVMKTSFKFNASRTLIEGLFGTFKLTYIYNFPNKKNITLLQILDKKYVYKSDIDEMAFGYDQNAKVKIIYSDLEKKIAGYNCNHATVIFENGLVDTTEIFYTKEIGLMHPNYNNPFKEIEGVLMEFSVNLVEINMKFSAKKVRKKKVDEKLFELPQGYINISEKQMKKLINDYNQSNGQ